MDYWAFIWVGVFMVSAITFLIGAGVGHYQGYQEATRDIIKAHDCNVECDHAKD